MAAPTTATTWVQDAPFGPISITLGPNGITRVEFPPLNALNGDLLVADGEKRDPTNKRSRRVGPIGRQFDEYFAGRRTAFDLPVDLPDTLSAFQRTVLTTLADDVAYGETVSYGELAEMAGRPGAARAVGTAMARNPLPFLIPCHRVVAANGIGGYGGGVGGGVELKRALLRLESGDRSRY